MRIGTPSPASNPKHHGNVGIGTTTPMFKLLNDLTFLRVSKSEEVQTRRLRSVFESYFQ